MNIYESKYRMACLWYMALSQNRYNLNVIAFFSYLALFECLDSEND